ncbi:odorant receptor 4-like [Papilio machaon]|uniref:odorant receptor 4-like n=1 Tax=Papilio machaon TaxID=76193 RepID=UPI001E6637B4|nr:odorant receptor 4-like [Papilio machaon]
MDIPKFEEFFIQINTSYWLLGIPFGKNNIRIRFYIFLVLVFLMAIGEINFCVTNVSSKNLLELTQLAPCLSVGVLSILKIVCIALKRNKINNLVISLKDLYDNIINDNEKKNIVKDDLLFLYVLIKTYFILNMLLIMMYNFSTIFIMIYHYFKTSEVNFMLPYAILLPFTMDLWYEWILVYMYSITSGFLCVLFYTAVDILYYILTSHVCNHFKLLSFDLQNLTDGNLLGHSVKRHQYLLKLSEDLEDIFTAPNFFNVLVGSLEICALGFTLTFGGGIQLLGVILFLISVLLQMYMMCLFVETLMRKSASVGEMTYFSNWHCMDKSSKKTILLIITRSNKEKYLTAYKFSVISYKCFTKIISTSWTYFTILRTLYTESE